MEKHFETINKSRNGDAKNTPYRVFALHLAIKSLTTLLVVLIYNDAAMQLNRVGRADMPILDPFFS